MKHSCMLSPDINDAIAHHPDDNYRACLLVRRHPNEFKSSSIIDRQPSLPSIIASS